MTPQQALDIKFFCNDLDEDITFREYFQKLLNQLWYEGEGFSGKRPFGNSGWQDDIYEVLDQMGIKDDQNEFVVQMIECL